MHRLTLTEMIASAVGGNWHYNRHAQWWEDDKGTIVRWTISCDCDDYCNHHPQLWLYGRGIPQRLILNEMTLCIS